MDRGDVTPTQAKKVAAWVTPALTKLAALHERLVARGFPPDDPFLQRVAAAHEAVRLLRLELHDLERRTPPKHAPEVPQWIAARRGQ